MSDLVRCAWVGADPLYKHYHDTEWGVVERDDQALFAKLVLDGFQAGLSWITILRKRDNFLRVFEGFDPERLALWGEDDIARALLDPGIVRNRAKVRATVDNARAWLRFREEHGSFADYLWSFTGGSTVVNRWEELGQLPAETAESRAMSKSLKSKGFRFCGPTICYAFMQAVGMVNDHTLDCFRHDQV